MDNFTLLSLDPSSTCTGYALLSSPERVVDAGCLKPKRQKDSPICRIEVMCDDLRSLILGVNPGRVVIEIPSGKVARRIRAANQGAGLSVFGMAAGAMVATARWSADPPRRVWAVDELTWTGCRPKKVRAIEIAALFPAYRKIKDPGLNIADAIGIGRWWFLSESAKGRAR